MKPMKPITRIESSLAAAIATGEEAGCPPKLAGAIRQYMPKSEGSSESGINFKLG